jgi:N-acylneuraminate cytidylyltransferase
MECVVKKRGTIAVIPARGGSKRLPRKNVLDFFGKPMIAWTIDACRQAGIFDRVLVSTDDPTIATCARDHGVEVPFLRIEAYDDHAAVADATIAALNQCATHLGEEFETTVQLMPNCPLRDAADIRNAAERFQSIGARFQISCFRFGWMNPWWALRLDDKGRGDPLFPEAVEQRSQDLPPLYCPSGAIWIARTDALREARTFYGPDHRFHCLPWMSALDIDDDDDLALARAVFLLKHSRSTLDRQVDPGELST